MSALVDDPEEIGFISFLDVVVDGELKDVGAVEEDWSPLERNEDDLVSIPWATDTKSVGAEVVVDITGLGIPTAVAGAVETFVSVRVEGFVMAGDVLVVKVVWTGVRQHCIAIMRHFLNLGSLVLYNLGQDKGEPN